MFTVDGISERRPWLIHFPNDVYETEKNLREIDDGYRVFWNEKKKRYEVHNLNSQGTSICITAKVLDGRIEHRINKSMVAYHGDELDEIDSYNKMIDDELERKNREQLEDASEDLFNPLLRANEKDELHTGYNHMHIMPNVRKVVKENDRNGNKGSSTVKSRSND